ncbi:MAG: hypothetical protein FJ264_08780 [Planctomycetes bacterium]|nr:hypothetical protein [Planctomycetota bacterium]
MPGRNNRDTIINLAIKDLGLSALFTFIGVNLRFFTENTLTALVFFNVIQTDDPASRFDIHSPSPPDMTGDVVTTITFTIAYLFFTTFNVRTALTYTIGDKDTMNNQYTHAIKHLKNCHTWVKNFIIVVLTGYGINFFSKYILSMGLEAAYIENNALSNMMGIISNGIQICYPFIFVYAYCKYVYPNAVIALLLYIFFLVRNLFATGVVGFVGVYDLHVTAPFLDWLTFLIFFYSIGCISMHHSALKLFRKVDFNKNNQ